jgi:site-specific DNA recombinase
MDARRLQALLTAAASALRPFDVLLVDDSSRVARDLADALRILQRLKFAGVRVIYISQAIDSASEQAETLVAVHGLVDNLYIRELAAKTKRGLAGQLERGFATGSRTYGYSHIPVPDSSGRLDASGRPAMLGKRLVVNDVEAAIVKRVFEQYASGVGVGTIARSLTADGFRGTKGHVRHVRNIERMLGNERYTGLQIWGQLRYERRPGTRQRVARHLPRSEWRIVERPELRIVSADIWARVQARRAATLAKARQHGSALLRGRGGAMQSRHLFSGFMQCAVCNGSISVVSGSNGNPRYGCQQAWKHGPAACTNRLDIRATLADAVLLKGLQAELLRPETLEYITEQLALALNAVASERPQARENLQRAKETAAQRLKNLVDAVEAGAGTPSVFQAIRDRETELRSLESQLEALAAPPEHRLAVVPTWVQQQLEDAAGLIAETPERAKLEFQRLGIRFTVRPVYDEGPRPFLRAEGSGQFEHLAFSALAPLPATGQFRPRSTP